jgi:alkyldihydroxyacetonephosphate synthase
MVVGGGQARKMLAPELNRWRTEGSHEWSPQVLWLEHREHGGLDKDERDRLFRFLFDRLGVEPRPVAAPRLEDINLRPPRVTAPATIAGAFTEDPYERLLHTYGKSYPETVCAFARDFANAPDLVAIPQCEADVSAILDWAERRQRRDHSIWLRVLCRGRSPADCGNRYAGVVSLDLRRLDRVVEIDETSRAARIQAGIRGPAIEAPLKPHGLSIRHYPQSSSFPRLEGGSRPARADTLPRSTLISTILSKASAP